MEMQFTVNDILQLIVKCFLKIVYKVIKHLTINTLIDLMNYINWSLKAFCHILHFSKMFFGIFQQRIFSVVSSITWKMRPKKGEEVAILNN